MTLELTVLPLALLAGILSVLSPCVWPLVPVVMGSAVSSGRFGPYALALGLSLSFALAGTLLSFILVSLGLDPELFRYFAAVLLLAVSLPLIIKSLGEWLSLKLSTLTSRFDINMSGEGGWKGQLGIGLLLGLVWLPCVGPTLGAAIALASMGQDMVTSFLVMLSFGLGTGSILLISGLLSSKALSKWRPQMMQRAGQGKVFLGWMLLFLGFFVLTGIDKLLEAWALTWLPDWAITL
ncbi:cytochrome c biogenesis CcdA family protein [Halomonas elongata]|uniref:cytochrome c biogenesis CcdA family protein n=1 Tax=Halomonas elongata TaxID=2746 RepID=UPI0023B0EDFA|nr:cytochrome c biogenesis protein CcdA [Halomonas elongata]